MDRVRGWGIEGRSLVLCRDPGGQTKVLDVGGKGGVE